MRLRLIPPPPFLEPPVPGAREGIWHHRAYSRGDCWYATRLPEGYVEPMTGEPRAWAMYPLDASEDPEENAFPLKISPEHTSVVPAIVVLPNGIPWCLHSPTCGEKGWGPKGWEVSGSLPDVTVTPSIDYGRPEYPESHWHAHITAGRFTG